VLVARYLRRHWRSGDGDRWTRSASPRDDGTIVRCDAPGRSSSYDVTAVPVSVTRSANGNGHGDGNRRFRAYGPGHLDKIAARFGIPPEAREDIRRVSLVLPFRVNEYVLSELIDWARVPADPIYQLVFPQRGMLAGDDERRLDAATRPGADPAALAGAVSDIRRRMNPHPSGQMEFNVPSLDGVRLDGLQHKYRETVLYFPGHGQTCHAYCTYCFRWAQFVGDPDLRFSAPGPERLLAHLRAHPEVTDVLVTGGDPMVMSASLLRSHIEPVLGVDTVRTVRIGTKSLSYWPRRFVSDHDADDVLRLFESIVASGRLLAVMAHFSHPRELEPAIVRTAIDRIRATGAVLYCQAPLVAHVNDDASTLADLWRGELAAGAVPYYLFVERETGPYGYFRVPLARAHDLYSAAYAQLSGLARTVRGPVMSATAGKIVVDGVEEAADGRYFQLRMLQARDPRLVGRPFRARYSDEAGWIDDLELDAGVPADIWEALRGVRLDRRRPSPTPVLHASAAR
jgi:L-lysine 2,3-aminomutase